MRGRGLDSEGALRFRRRVVIRFDAAMPVYRCPTCDRTVVVRDKHDAPHRPFCSERCKMVDLGRWLDGTYVISEPVERKDLEDADDLGGELA